VNTGAESPSLSGRDLSSSEIRRATAPMAADLQTPCAAMEVVIASSLCPYRYFFRQ
jgi:hypothetical protein